MLRVRKLIRPSVNRLHLAHLRSRLVAAEPTFILSTGRTGTQFFEGFFERISNRAICRHEPSPDLFDLGIEKIRRPRGDYAEKILLRRCRLIGNVVAANQSYIESNPFLSYLIPDVVRAFPDCRMIWIVRDPKTYLPSAYSKSSDGSGQHLFYGDDDRRQRVRADDFPDDPWCHQWEQLDRFERICWYWNHCNRTIERDFDALPEKRTLRVHFEDIFGENRTDHLRSIVEFIGLDPSNVPADAGGRKANASQQHLLPDVATWTESHRAAFNQLTAEMRERLGFASID